MTDVTSVQLDALRNFADTGRFRSGTGSRVTTVTIRSMEKKGLIVYPARLLPAGLKVLSYHGWSTERLVENWNDTIGTWYTWEAPPPPPPPTPRALWLQERKRLTRAIEGAKAGREEYIARYDALIVEMEQTLARLVTDEVPED